MYAYIARRLLLAIPTMLVVLTVIFLGVRVLPGDPAVVMLGDQASDQAIEQLRERIGLDRPLWVQYTEFLSNFVRGNLGKSMLTGYPVARQVKRALPYTLELTGGAILIGVLIGIPLGVITALHRNQFLDYIGRIFSLIGQAIPSFYLAILLMALFAIQLDWFPAIGGGERGNFIGLIWHLFLPALGLGLAKAAYVTRMTRVSMLGVLSEDYIQTARAKGLKERTVNYIHALKPALVPIISVIGIYSIITLGGSVMVEIVFSRPGLGRMMIGGMLRRDYTTLQSVMALFASFVVIINLVTDILCSVTDPRIRY